MTTETIHITESDLSLIADVIKAEGERVVVLKINANRFLDLDDLIDRGYAGIDTGGDLKELKEEERASRNSALMDKIEKQKKEETDLL